MPAPAPLPDALPHPAFAVRDALRIGVDPNRLRRSDLRTPFRGVRETAASESLVERCAALATVLRPDAFFCGPTAALLWGIPLPRELADDERLHVGHPHRQRPTRLSGVVGHHFVITPAELTSRDGLPLTTPERTWCDLAAYLSLHDLVAAGDRVIWRRDPLAPLGDVHEMVRRHPGRRGALTRAAAVGQLSDRADSPPESHLRLRFRDAGLPPVSPNLEVRAAGGGLVAEIDLAFRAYRVGVDYEGDHHRVERRQWMRDLRRFADLEDAGWSMVRATADDLADTGRLVASVRRRLASRGWPG